MMSTPFGPLPPPPPPASPAPARSDQSTNTTADPAPATQSSPPPVVPPADAPDTGIRPVTTTPTIPANPSLPPPVATSDPMESGQPPLTSDDFTIDTADADPEGSWLALGGDGPARTDLLPGILMAFGVMVALVVMMRHLRRKQSSRPYIPPAEDRIAALHERATSTISPIERAMSSAEELARRLAATMENKAARLELLIEEADRKLEELNRAVAQTSRPAPVPATTAERNGRAVRTIDPTLLDRARVEQDRAERNGHNGYHDPANPPGTHAMTQTPSAEIKRPAPNFPADPVHRRVWALADDGMPAMDIARSLNQPVGQVELILNLRKSG